MKEKSKEGPALIVFSCTSPRCFLSEEEEDAEVQTEVEKLRVLERLDPKLRKIVAASLACIPTGGLSSEKVQDTFGASACVS